MENLPRCEDCIYCQCRYLARIVDNIYRCKAVKYKTIDTPILNGNCPTWCPLIKDKSKVFECEICHCTTPIECEGSEPNTCADCMPLADSEK